MRTLIAVPCMDQVAAPFAQNLAQMQKNGEVYISFLIGSLIYESRNNLAKQAMQAKADYIMWLDSDMTFAPDTMTRLQKHMENGLDIVTGIYFRRRPPFTPTLFKELRRTDDPNVAEHANFDDYPSDSLFEIAGCGFGCVMTRVSVLEDVMLNYQDWFGPVCGLGEDLSFCLRARELGYKIYCDSSIKCGHIGQLVVDEDVFRSTRSVD